MLLWAKIAVWCLPMVPPVPLEEGVLIEFLLNHWWAGIAIWAPLYISDYYFTLACARLYQRSVKQFVEFEGSFELTPIYQKDIDSLRRVSPIFIKHLVLASVLFLLLWWCTGVLQLRELYLFLIGSKVLMQATVHMRHLTNFFSFRSIAAGRAIRGHVYYDRTHVLRQSSFQILCYAGLYAFLFFFTPNLFLLGGSFGCVMTALRHWQLANKHAASAAAAPDIRQQPVPQSGALSAG